MTRTIPLPCGRVTVVDDEDYASLSLYRWQYNERRACVQRMSRKPDGTKTTVRMHRQIMDAKPGEIVDHIDGDPLRNVRSNMRITNVSGNTRNSGKYGLKIGRATTSRYKGVYWDKTKRKWRASIYADGKRHRLGRFRDEEAAARAYDAAAKELHGEYARLNFVEEGRDRPETAQHGASDSVP